MIYIGDSMGLLDAYRRVRRWWQLFGLEDACEGKLDEWEGRRPEYISKIRGWVESGDIPDDVYLAALCRTYQRRVQPR